MRTEPSNRTPDDRSDSAPIIGGTEEEKARIVRRGSCLLRSCFVAIVATAIFEGVVLGWTKFGWVGAILGPFAIYVGGALIGVLAGVVLIGATTFGDRHERPKPRAGGGPRPLPPEDDEGDAPRS